jgi:hypothetical protein
MLKKGIVFTLLFVLISTMVLHPAFAEMKFKWGPYLRLRYEYWNNIFDMNSDIKDTRSFFRIKDSIWGQVDFNESLMAYGRITNESKAYMEYYLKNTKQNTSYDIGEFVFDNLYGDIKNMFKLPIDLRVGRQDFLNTYGEGFLIMDGTPLDGSRTYYFNAAKAAWKINEKNSLDFLFISDTATDDYLPVINPLDPEQQLNASDELAGALYHKCDYFENLHWENYYIYKKEDGGGPKLSAKESNINTIGTYAKYSFTPWTARGQLAYQFGDYGDNDRTGLGGFGFIDREFSDIAWKPQASLGFIYLSGDDMNDSRMGAWDPLFSRWPWMSELYILAYSSESGMGYWTNLQMYRAQLVLKPTDKLKFTFWYNYLRANENIAPVAGTFSGDGKERGHLPQVRADYAFNKIISSYILVEYFIPENFYVEDADPAIFARAEVQIKF